MTATAIQGQKLEIHNLTDNYGLLPLRLGHAKVIETYKRFIHIINLTNYEQSIEEIRKSLDTLENDQTNSDTVKIANIKFSQLELKLQTLLPKHKLKRGLIDGLGTIIKTITGNMDANDAININEEIKKLNLNQNILEIETNQQISINKKMIERFDNITRHINEQQKTIESFLHVYNANINNALRTDQEVLKHLQYVHKIIFNIDLLYNHLINIAEAVTFARLHIISKQILTKTELNEIRSLLEKQSINFSSDEEIYEILQLQAYYNNSNIVFSIEIPITSQTNYSFFHLIPLPINKTLYISTYPYVATHESDALYFGKACDLIEDIYLCESKDKQKTKFPECVPKIINNHPAICNLSNGLESNQILQPENNYILLTDVRNISVETTCGINKYNIYGTALLHYQNCSITINNITYDSKADIFWDSIVIHPPTRSQINSSTITQHLSLNKLHLDQLQNREEIHLLTTKSTAHIASIWLLLIPLTAILTFMHFQVKTRKSPKIETPKIEDNQGAPSRGNILWQSLR